MRYEKNLQTVYENARQFLLKALHLRHISGRAGRLEDESRNIKDYRAVFVFKLEDAEKIRDLERLLENIDYNIGIEFKVKKYDFANIPKNDLWSLVLISSLEKPAEQEKQLVRALNELCKILEKTYFKSRRS